MYQSYPYSDISISHSISMIIILMLSIMYSLLAPRTLLLTVRATRFHDEGLLASLGAAMGLGLLAVVLRVLTGFVESFGNILLLNII